MKNTKIEWADDTENFAGGCSEARLKTGKMDPACVHCYARLQSARNEAIASAAGRVSIYTGVADRSGNTATWTGRMTWDRDLMRRRFQAMKGGRRVFLGSMTDLWHADHDPALLVALAEEIRGLGKRPPEKRPILITLTKRADRLLAWQREHFPDGLPAWVWPGVTAGCQEAVNERVNLLRSVRAAGPRVISVEPMTGPVDLSMYLKDHHHRALLLARDGRWGTCSGCPRDGDGTPHPKRCQYTDRYDHNLEDDRIGWVITGGESGPKARPSHPGWFRSLRDQCVAAGVPFFFKQWGEWMPRGQTYSGGCIEMGVIDAARFMSKKPLGTFDVRHAEIHPDDFRRVGKHAAGRLLDGRTWDEVPHA